MQADQETPNATGGRIGLVAHPAGDQTPITSNHVKNWTDPAGTAVADFYRDGPWHCIRFPKIGDFSWQQGGSDVTCRPVSEAMAAACRDLFATQIYPLVCSACGDLVLHAGVVEIDDAAFLFAGPSGRGKSTLASRLAAMGYRILSDDVAVLKCSGDSFVVEPGDGALRLWEDSTNALFAERDDIGTIQYNDKRRIPLGKGISHCNAARAVAGVFHLAEPSQGETAIEPLSPGAAFGATFGNMFVFDGRDADSLSRQFEQITDLASCLPHFRVTYPRSYDALDEVCVMILGQLRA